MMTNLLERCLYRLESLAKDVAFSLDILQVSLCRRIVPPSFPMPFSILLEVLDHGFEGGILANQDLAMLFTILHCLLETCQGADYFL